VWTAADNTFASPWAQRPLDHGFSVVVHSTTKYLNGHSDVIGGIAIVGDDHEPSDRLKVLQNAVGGIAGPLGGFLVLRQCAHDRRGARPSSVGPPCHLPGIADSSAARARSAPDERVRRHVTVELATDLAGCRRMLERVGLFTLAESLGGTDSLIEHPAIMTHASVPVEQRRALGIGDSLVRLSIGTGDVDDLTADLGQALAGIAERG